MIPRHLPLVVTTRGRAVECVHYGSIAVVDERGGLVASAGDPQASNFARSSLKPLQALPFVEDEGPAHWRFGERELALLCSSHSGEPMHVQIVARMLARIGCEARHLRCGCQVPLFYNATGRTPPPRRTWSALHHNCSGKHGGFLAYCRMHRQSVARYLDPQNELQRRIRASVARYAGGARLMRGTDGCSALNYAFPLAGLARFYAELATGATRMLREIGSAMRRHPELVSGTRRFDLALARAGRGDWIAKAGAAGVQALGIGSLGLGVVVRIADATPLAVRCATIEALRQLHLNPGAALERDAHPAIRNARGIETGRVLPAFKLKRGSHGP